MQAKPSWQSKLHSLTLYLQAITNGNFGKLEDSIKKMKHHDVDKYLDVHSPQSVDLIQTKETVEYYMTLLAHAGVLNRKEMVEFLVQNAGAGKCVALTASHNDNACWFR